MAIYYVYPQGGGVILAHETYPSMASAEAIQENLHNTSYLVAAVEDGYVASWDTQKRRLVKAKNVFQGSMADKIAAARDKSTPKHVLAKLANLKVLVIDWNLSQNEAASASLLNQLVEQNSTGGFGRIRFKVALHPKTSKETLHKLAQDPDREVRIYTAQHKNTSVDDLVALSDDKDEAVQARVAQNPKTPLAILKKLVESYSTQVRLDTIKNPKLTKALLFRLSGDTDPVVRTTAQVVYNRHFG